MNPEERWEREPLPDLEESRPLQADRVRALFDSRSTFTVALEEDVMLLEPTTLALSRSAERALGSVAGDQRFAYGLREAQVELLAPVSGNATAAALHLATARLELAERLDGEILVAAAGTHPSSSSWGGLSGDDRHRRIAHAYGVDRRRHLGCGLRVQVAVPGSERALAAFNAARSFLPEIGALAANSPFLEGADTGFASVRSQLALAPHRTGVPPAFDSWEEFAAFVEWRRQGRLLFDASELWWDVRPFAEYGTLEFRVADAQTRVEDAAATAAICHALVVWLAGRHDRGERLPVHEPERIAENAWQAARYGTRGSMADLETGAPEETRDRISRLLGALEPTAERLGLSWALFTARALLVDNGAERQRYVCERHGVSGLVRWLAEETVSSAREYLMQRR